MVESLASEYLQIHLTNSSAPDAVQRCSNDGRKTRVDDAAQRHPTDATLSSQRDTRGQSHRRSEKRVQTIGAATRGLTTVECSAHGRLAVPSTLLFAASLPGTTQQRSLHSIVKERTFAAPRDRVKWREVGSVLITGLALPVEEHDRPTQPT